MPFASALSEHPDAAIAAGEVTGTVLDQLGAEPDVALLFVTAHHEDVIAEVASVVRTLLAPTTLAGAAAVSVVGTDREVEEQPAITLWAGRVGHVHPLRIGGAGLDDDGGWPVDGHLGFRPSAAVVVGDPYSFPAERFFDAVHERHPRLPVLGGMASAAREPGGTRLVLDDMVHATGAVGFVLGPGVTVDAVVSQGCRPVGQPWAVTDAEHNIVKTLAGQPPLQRLNALAEDGLTEEEVAIVNHGGLHVGRVIDESKIDFGPGDFLVRNVLGGDRATGAMAIAEVVEIGTTLQFHLRDPVAADEELRGLLGGRRADSALLFTCNGRGKHTFGTPDHDARVVSDALGNVPCAGFFAAGEFGPIGGRNFVHGFTASIALLRDRR